MTTSTTTGLVGFIPSDDDDNHHQELNEHPYFTECDSLMVPLELESLYRGKRGDGGNRGVKSSAADVVSTVFARICGGSSNSSSSRISSMSSDTGHNDGIGTHPEGAAFAAAIATLRRVLLVVHAIWGSILLLVLIMDITLFVEIGHVGRFWYYDYFEEVDASKNDDDGFTSYLPSSHKNLLDVVALGILGLTAVMIGLVSLCSNHSNRLGHSRARCLVRVATLYYHGLFLFYGGMCLMHIDITLSNGNVFKIGSFYKVATMAWLVMALLHMMYHRNVYTES